MGGAAPPIARYDDIRVGDVNRPTWLDFSRVTSISRASQQRLLGLCSSEVFASGGNFRLRKGGLRQATRDRGRRSIPAHALHPIPRRIPPWPFRPASSTASTVMKISFSGRISTQRKNRMSPLVAATWCGTSRLLMRCRSPAPVLRTRLIHREESRMGCDSIHGCRTEGESRTEGQIHLRALRVGNHDPTPPRRSHETAERRRLDRDQ